MKYTIQVFSVGQEKPIEMTYKNDGLAWSSYYEVVRSQAGLAAAMASQWG